MRTRCSWSSFNLAMKWNVYTQLFRRRCPSLMAIESIKDAWNCGDNELSCSTATFRKKIWSSSWIIYSYSKASLTKFQCYRNCFLVIPEISIVFFNSLAMRPIFISRTVLANQAWLTGQRSTPWSSWKIFAYE